MPYLADTNTIFRRILPNDPLHPLVSQAFYLLDTQQEQVFITPQNLIEFHALATRPINVNGLGMSSAQARLEAKRMEAIFPLLPDTASIYSHWVALIEKYDVMGKPVHDARLVAVMLAHGITHLLTLNASHFRRFTEITVVEPQGIVTTVIP